MTDLTDFGVDDTTPGPPQVRKREAIHISTGGGVRHVGHLVDVPTDGYPRLGYLTTRDSEEHRLRAVDGYAVEVHGLEQIAYAASKRGADRPGVVFVHETDTNDVYEFTAAQLFEGEYVPDGLNPGFDAQRYVARSDAEHIWADHGGREFYLTRSGRERDE